MAVDNKSIGRFNLTGIPPAPRRVPQIEVIFDIDANGILSVTAKDKATNKEQSIRIEGSGGLTEAEIDKMVKDAEANADADKERREKVEVRNSADQLVYQTEKQMEELGDKLAEEPRKRLTEAVEKVKEALKAENLTAIKESTEALQKLWHEEAGKMYAASQAEAQAKGGDGAPAGGDAEAAGGGAASEGDEAVDADFEVVEEDKK